MCFQGLDLSRATVRGLRAAFRPPPRVRLPSVRPGRTPRAGSRRTCGLRRACPTGSKSSIFPRARYYIPSPLETLAHKACEFHGCRFKDGSWPREHTSIDCREGKMTERDMAVTGETVSYSYRPSLLGASREFSLTGHSIDWVAGARSGSTPFG